MCRIVRSPFFNLGVWFGDSVGMTYRNLSLQDLFSSVSLFLHLVLSDLVDPGLCVRGWRWSYWKSPVWDLRLSSAGAVLSHCCLQRHLLPPSLGLSDNVSSFEIAPFWILRWVREGTSLGRFRCCIPAFSGVCSFQTMYSGQQKWHKSSNWLIVGQMYCICWSGLTYFPLGSNDR